MDSCIWSFLEMSCGTPPLPANGFTSGSVNRPWHRSRPTAAARPWIMHGGKFQKMTSALNEALLKLCFWRKSEAEPSRSWNIFVQTVLQSRSCNMPRCLRVLNKLFLALFYWRFSIYTDAWGLCGVTVVWELCLQSFFNPLWIFVTQQFCHISSAVIHFVHHVQLNLFSPPLSFEGSKLVV